MTHITAPVKPNLRIRLQYYRKGLIAALPAAFAIAFAIWGPDNVWVVAAASTAAAFGVWRIPNREQPKKS